MPDSNPKIVVVMPAYYAEKTLEKTFKDLPKNLISEIILVDDASGDRTAIEAKKLGIKTFVHKQNVGYGGNQKTCYWEAQKSNADIIIMLHPDYQYDGTKIPALVEPILKGEYDVMLGSRIRTRQETLAGGMPPIKYLGNRILTTIANIILGTNLSEHLSGFRAYSSKALEVIPFQRFSNNFVFDQQFIFSAVSYGFKVGETPVPVRYFKEASSIGGWKGIKYVLDTLFCFLLYVLHQLGLIKSRMFR
ncbi:glycosyl transferase family 2 [Candidatus Roizmanbacteria bacterium CG22_combo_CG10-13_8_21_14_all_38_20]|uniref:Glycosyl transferase family 2 n=1 Tax=Candidatus Roizmanbacteria bacterium CG22_combo_CG10-13_8_21_14_all_38_20 TaxID=1974862 RepID=A0A2H0BVS9_9BACT|nr:glycosyltransferase family 2 protein [Candidatus Microgenomates bacterium]PIP61741.1 MAG: glycosyl transferase family 2 [Candidatus Roizmanbacteria bacterium CG22_combo_CG10-13_8_21_14_all_38_20]PJC32049.1 MAG: glycosyl transferase family 2 [Candidatus Roizmanbacteria bacterium CG_4_9_14_0_2_um_filter_38_17]